MTNEGATKYPKVFRPLKLGPVEVPNRIYMSPHGIPLEAPVPGREAYRAPAIEAAYYLAERAAGGVGLVFHSTIVSPLGRQVNLMATPWLEEAIPSYARVAEAVHRHGAKIMAEIWYAEFLEKAWEPLGPQAPILGPSAVQQWYMPNVMREMTKEEIHRCLQDFGVTARNLRDAGYDGVEVHASHGTMVEYFLSPSFNRRTDEYGGSLENRMRFLTEALDSVRDNVSSQMAVGIRLTADQLLPTGYNAADCRQIVAMLVKRGVVDYIDLDVSVEPEQMNLMVTSFLMPKHHNAARVAEVRSAAGPVPVLATPGRVTSIAEAEQLLADNVADMIGAVRGLIAEPYLVKNAAEGREEQSRTCIAANHCLDAAQLNGFGCAINPEAGREPRWRAKTRTRAPRSMNVVVVGGGPGGLEAARIAGVRGHSVTLFETRESIGGNLRLWSMLPGREHVGTLLNWYGGRLPELGVKMHLGVHADREMILDQRPDVVVVATGSRYARDGDNGFLRQPIPGWDKHFVLTPEDVLERNARITGKVIVLDEEGLHAAAGMAEIAASRGAQVQLVTRKAGPAAHQPLVQGEIVSRLIRAGVALLPGTWVKSIGDGSVTLLATITQQTWEVEADTVILATMRKPVNDLEVELTGQVPYVYVVGDALSPRTLREATYEGHRFGRVIGEEHMPATTTEDLFAPIEGLKPAQFL